MIEDQFPIVEVYFMTLGIHTKLYKKNQRVFVQQIEGNGKVKVTGKHMNRGRWVSSWIDKDSGVLGTMVVFKSFADKRKLKEFKE